MAVESAATGGESSNPPPGAQTVVMRNALLLVLAQVGGMPLSIIVNAAMARHLGPEDFGYVYLAQTMASLGFLVVDWGQQAALPARVAQERARANYFLGSGLAWRLASAAIVYGVLAGASFLLGYDQRLQAVLALVVVGQVFAAATSAFQDTIRGFERADVAAKGLVGQQFLSAALIVPTLLLGGALFGALAAQSAAYAIVCAFVYGALRKMNIGALTYDRAVLKDLLSYGTPFMFMGIVLYLQPNVDNIMLSKLGSVDSVGWFAAAKKLIGVLMFPAAALHGALFPTLARLHAEDREQFRQNISSAMKTSTILVVPVSLGCALYADIGISIFSRSSFGPAEDDLRVLSLFLFLLYFTMVLGSGISASGRQREWVIAQFSCVGVSAAINFVLIPYFQQSQQNGGLGVSISNVVCEVLMTAIGAYLMPPGTFNRKLMKGFGLALVAGVAMGTVGWLLRGLNHFVSAPIAVVVYFGTLWLVGGLDKSELQALKSIVKKKRG
jgi:O-antigen/teichoic acid export membrane protein